MRRRGRDALLQYALHPRKRRIYCRYTVLRPVQRLILLAQVLEVFGLDRFEASERDILWGAAIAAAP